MNILYCTRGTAVYVLCNSSNSFTSDRGKEQIKREREREDNCYCYHRILVYIEFNLFTYTEKGTQKKKRRSGALVSKVVGAGFVVHVYACIRLYLYPTSG